MTEIVVEFPALYRRQRELLFAPQRYVWIEGATKSGKTHGGLSWFIYHAFHDAPGTNSSWVAPVGAQAKIAFARALRYIPLDLRVANLTERSIEIRGAGKMWFRGADRPDSLYGDDNARALIDEATRMKESAYEAVRSTLTATGGQLRAIANVTSRSNWFYHRCRAAESGLEGHLYGKLTAWDAVAAGVVTREEIEDAREALRNRPGVFEALYECVPPDDGGNPFGLRALGACRADGLAQGPPVVWGWDLAKSVDWTVGVGLNAAGEVCALERFQLPWEHTFDRILLVSRDVPMLVDSTGVGDPIVERLQHQRGDVEGFKFTAQSKQALIEGLSVAIGSGETRFPADTELDRELHSFEYLVTRTGVRYEAPPGLHDDAVCAYALAWRLYEQSVKFRPAAVPVVTFSMGRRTSGLQW